MRNGIRKAVGSGMWFPDNGTALRHMVEGFIDGAQIPASDERLVGILAPHAGYMYSGKVAGHAYRAVREAAAGGHAPEVVAVLGFAHRGGFRGVALMDGNSFETPVGRTMLDPEAAEILTDGSSRISIDYSPHLGEHSAENQIPFLQVALPESRLVMAIMGDRDTSTVNELAERLGRVAERKPLLVVASSDMLHDESYERVRRIDRQSLDHLTALKGRAILSGWEYANQTFCGLDPVLTLVDYARARGCKAGRVLHYRNSGDDYPESRGQWVVGYSAVAFGVPR